MFLIKNNSKHFNLLKINDLNFHLNVNYFSSLLIIKELVSSMKKKKWGRILLTSSIGTKFGGGKTTFGYSLSKYMNEFFPYILKENMEYKNIFSIFIKEILSKKSIEEFLKKK